MSCYVCWRPDENVAWIASADVRLQRSAKLGKLLLRLARQSKSGGGAALERNIPDVARDADFGYAEIIAKPYRSYSHDEIVRDPATPYSTMCHGTTDTRNHGAPLSDHDTRRAAPASAVLPFID
jgi:hypothetical protein